MASAGRGTTTRRKRRNNARGASGNAAEPSKTDSDLVAQAHGLRDQGDLEHAIQFYERALQESDSAHLDCLNSLGECYAEQGDHEKAIQVFRKCVDVDPEHAGHAWMYLGQFMEGKQALESFANGVKSFQKQIEDLQENMHNDEKYGEDVKIASKERELLTRQLMSAYSTMAELYMTDLCDDEDAEQRCEEILMHALQCDDRNVEVLSTLANFRLCQQKPDVAKQAIHEAANRLSEIEDEVQKHYVMAHDPDNEKMDGQSNGNNGPAVSSVLAPALPPYATRSSLAKAAMETECYSDALTVLEGLLAEDDTDLELWFLIAEAYFHSGDPHTALQYVGDALQEVNKRLERGSGDEQEKAENNAAKSQLTKLQKAIKSNIEG